jgi:hypothetical protein
MASTDAGSASAQGSEKYWSSSTANRPDGVTAAGEGDSSSSRGRNLDPLVNIDHVFDCIAR